MIHLIVLILSLCYIMHLLNTVFKSFCSLIHDNVLLILIICSCERIFQSVISSMFKCFQSFSKSLKSFNVDSIASAQFCTINVVVAL